MANNYISKLLITGKWWIGQLGTRLALVDGMMTKHTCDESQRAFGRRVAGCPRCEELKNGAPARAGWQKGYFAAKKYREEMEARAMREHFAPGGKHSRGECGPVCTAFDW